MTRDQKVALMQVALQYVSYDMTAWQIIAARRAMSAIDDISDIKTVIRQTRDYVACVGNTSYLAAYETGSIECVALRIDPELGTTAVTIAWTTNLPLCLSIAVLLSDNWRTIEEATAAAQRRTL